MKKQWKDSKGYTVPAIYVPKDVKAKEQIVTSIMKEAKAIKTKMEKFKKFAFEKIQKHMDSLSSEHFGDDWKGNLTLTNFSGTEQVSVSVKDIIEFDEKLLVAKQMIDKLIEEWTGDSDNKIKALIKSAFNVDTKGKVNTYLIIRITKLDIKDDKWKEAIDLIRASMQVKTTKNYINFKIRETPTSKWESIILDFAGI